MFESYYMIYNKVKEKYDKKKDFFYSGLADIQQIKRKFIYFVKFF